MATDKNGLAPGATFIRFENVCEDDRLRPDELLALFYEQIREAKERS